VCAKKSYRSLSLAMHHALTSSKSFGRPMRWYWCRVCKAYHLTSHV